MPSLEHKAVMVPSGRKLSSNSEQDILACVLAGVLGTPRGKKKD